MQKEPLATRTLAKTTPCKENTLTPRPPCSAVGRDLYAYLNVIVNPANDASLNRIYKTPARGMADKGWSAVRTAVCKGTGVPSLARVLLADLDGVVVDAAVVQEVRALCRYRNAARVW